MIKINESGYIGGKAGAVFNNNSRKRNSDMPAFTGKVPQIPTSSLRDAVEYILPSSTKALKFLGSNGGEIQNIIINAVGTGLVAPIFIKYNFLSEADEDTRTYSAWRQPVSAVLAVATQAGLTAPFYKIFDNWANNGTFGEALNKTPFQDEYYITKLVKKQHPNATKKQIRDYVRNIKESQRKALINMLEEDSTVFYSRKDGSKLKMSDASYRNLLNSTIDKLAKADKKYLDNIEKTIAKRTARSKYYRTHNKEATDLLAEFNTEISKARNMKEINSYLSQKILELKKDKNSGEMVAIFEEVRQRAKVVSGGKDAISFSDVQQALIEKVHKMQEHVKKYKDIKTDAEVEQIVEGIVHEEKTKLQSAIDFYKSLKTNINEKSNITELSKLIEEKCKELKIENSGLNKKFVDEVANQLISRSKTNMKWYKQFVGIFVSLSILPFTCTLLNWIYPRFMDVFFPNLSSKKHGKEASKLVEMAPKMSSFASTNLKPSQLASVSMSGNNFDSFKKKSEVA
ncbi:hypothetical protein IKP85_05245 [bacterium]|nr:hypothetical protein [bacterium]